MMRRKAIHLKWQLLLKNEPLHSIESDCGKRGQMESRLTDIVMRAFVFHMKLDHFFFLSLSIWSNIFQRNVPLILDVLSDHSLSPDVSQQWRADWTPWLSKKKICSLSCFPSITRCFREKKQQQQKKNRLLFTKPQTWLKCSFKSGKTPSCWNYATNSEQYIFCTLKEKKVLYHLHI